MLKIDRNMSSSVDYAAFPVDHISNIEISREFNYYTVNLEVKLYDKEELDEICRIIQKYHEKN